MTDINKANRQVCDVDIRSYSADRKPIMFYDRANVTTQDISADAVYARGKGARRVAFHNSVEGTATIEAQVYPFEFYSLIAGGAIEATGAHPVRKILKGGESGKIAIADETVVEGTVFVYAKGDWGGTAIEGSFSGGSFTATSTEQIVSGTDYEVGYIVTSASGIKKVSFNDKYFPKAYYISMKTVDKGEDDVLVGRKMIFYKAVPQKSFSMSQSSDDDPATITMTFDLMYDEDDNCVDMLELEDKDM